MKLIHFILLALISLAIGVVLHAIFNPSGRPQQGGRSSLPSGVSSRERSASLRADEIQRLTQSVAFNGGQEKWFRWIATLENASLADLPQFAQSVGNNKIALGLIAERWVSLDPEDAFRYLLSRRAEGDFKKSDSPEFLLAQLIFTKWTARDSEAVLVALDSPESLPGLDRLRRLFVDDLLKSETARALRIGVRRKVLDGTGGMSSEMKAWVKQDPRAAAQLLFELPSHKFLPTLAEVWADRDPAKALAFGLAQKSDQGLAFAKVAFARWAQDDFAAASRLHAQLPEADAQGLTPTLIQSWGKRDPIAALEWSQESLTGRLRNDSIEKIVLAAISSESITPREILARIQSPQALHQATVALCHKLIGFHYSREDPKLSEKLSWFDDVDDPKTFDQIFGDVSRVMADTDFERFRRFIVTPKALMVSEMIYLNALGSYAYTDGPGAMDLIRDLPEKYLERGSLRAFFVWRQNEPEKAMAWAGQLARNDPRRPHLFEANLSMPHEDVVAQVKALPPIYKEIVRDMMKSQSEDGGRHLRGDGTEIDFEKIREETESE